jgi:hypothetical protein
MNLYQIFSNKYMHMYYSMHINYNIPRTVTCCTLISNSEVSKYMSYCFYNAICMIPQFKSNVLISLIYHSLSLKSTFNIMHVSTKTRSKIQYFYTPFFLEINLPSLLGENTKGKGTSAVLLFSWIHTSPGRGPTSLKVGLNDLSSCD